eukprot:4468127-Prorocentrum_lima.AAC.1
MPRRAHVLRAHRGAYACHGPNRSVPHRAIPRPTGPQTKTPPLRVNSYGDCARGVSRPPVSE